MFKLKAPDGKNNICGNKIAQLRKQKKLSQRKMGAMLQLAGYDVDNYFIRRIENGERFVTDIELKMFSEFFKVDISELIK